MSYRFLGKRLPRPDAWEKVTGQVRYTQDMSLPGMVYARFLRSPYAHARIVAIDTTEAETLPGVRGILTYKDVPPTHPRGKLEYLLSETVHNPGEEVAMVAATTDRIAEKALSLIKIKYEILPAVFTIDEALKPGSPLANIEYGARTYHGTPYNPVPRSSPEGWLELGYGDVEAELKKSDIIFEEDFESPAQYNCSPLPRTLLVQWMSGVLHCWCDSQGVTRTREDIAACLGIPQAKVRVISSTLVGGYGAKEPQKIATLAAIMSKRLNTPVKVAYTRAEDAVQTHRRVDTRLHLKIGLKKDGTTNAISARMLTNYGRDSPFPFWVPAVGSVGTLNALYMTDASRAEVCQVITNILEHGAMNGFGDTEANYSLERAMDECAERVGLDPVAFRLKNCARYASRALDYRTVLTGPITWGVFGKDLNSLPECIRLVAARSGWQEKWQGWKTPVSVAGPLRRGIGIAIGMHHTQYRDCSAIVKMNRDGSADVLVSCQEMGQGSRTAIRQVVAETLGIGFNEVNEVLADTSVTPAGYANTGSAGTSSHITACKLAADDARNKFLGIAADKLKVGADCLQVKEGKIYITDKPDPVMSVAWACTLGFQVTGTANTPPTESIIDPETGRVIYHFAVGATVAEIEVDTGTGAIKILRLTSAHDCGLAINPQIIENQIDLSLTMASGWALTEDVSIDARTGVVLSANLADYKLMTFLDLPHRDDMRKSLVEIPCAWGPFGAKGMSETAHTTVAPAIANALYNAAGVRVRKGNTSPIAVLEALYSLENQGGNGKRGT